MSAQDNLNEDQFSEIVNYRGSARRGNRGAKDWKCASVSMHNEETHGLPAVFGSHDEAPYHVWNSLPGGAIFDATADQFGHKDNKGVRVVHPNDPDYTSYHPAEDQQRERSHYEFRKMLRG